MRSLLIFLASLCSYSLHAMTTVDLYDSEVVIAEEENAERNARIAGMQQVLVRASGSQDVLTNEVIQKALRQNDQFLSQISYGERDEQPTLVMKFNGRQIQSLLSQAQVSYWPERRENLLVWVVEDKGFEREIAWETTQNESLQHFATYANSRGLPYTAPVGDFEDVTGINASDLWGSFVAPIAQASARYPVDAVLLVRKQGEQARWTLYDQSPEQLSSSNQLPKTGLVAGTTEEQMKQVVDAVSTYYVGKNALTIGNDTTLSALVHIDGVSDAKDFFSAESLLKGLNTVASVDVVQIQQSEVIFRVHLLTEVQSFQRELSGNSNLAEVMVEAPIESEASEETAPSEQPANELSEEMQPASKSMTNEAGMNEVSEGNESLSIENTEPTLELESPEESDEKVHLYYQWIE